MKFSLHYRGPLKSNGSARDKYVLREYFHPQLADLWNRTPLKSQAHEFLDPTYSGTAIREVGGHKYSSVINENNHLIAEMNITFLRPQEPGGLISEGGDIDNRIKTLLDALSIPNVNQIGAGEEKTKNEEPLHCLFEDDNLINGLSIKMDRLLNSKNSSEVLILIEVDVSATHGTFDNLAMQL